MNACSLQVSIRVTQTTPVGQKKITINRCGESIDSAANTGRLGFFNPQNTDFWCNSSIRAGRCHSMSPNNSGGTEKNSNQPVRLEHPSIPLEFFNPAKDGRCNSNMAN